MPGGIIAGIQATFARFECKQSRKNNDNDTTTGGSAGRRSGREKERSLRDDPIAHFSLATTRPAYVISRIWNNFDPASSTGTVKYDVKRNRAINAPLPRARISARCEARLEVHSVRIGICENFFNKATEKKIFRIRMLHKLSDALSKFYNLLKLCHRRYFVLPANLSATYYNMRLSFSLSFVSSQRGHFSIVIHFVTLHLKILRNCSSNDDQRTHSYRYTFV